MHTSVEADILCDLFMSHECAPCSRFAFVCIVIILLVAWASMAAQGHYPIKVEAKGYEEGTEAEDHAGTDSYS